MTRRTFTHIVAACATTSLFARCTSSEEIQDVIMTVKGPISAGNLGTVLSHEHILVDFADAETASLPGRYNQADVFSTVLPYLRQIDKAGCEAFFDFTPAYLGRDPQLLKRLSDAAGLHIVTNTGYYGALGGVHLPAHALVESEDELAARWIEEFEEGIDGTGIRPGFIKIGVEPGPLSEQDARLVRAGARAHKATGLTIAVHTGPGAGAFDQLAIFADEGIDPSAWIWVHAQAEFDITRHVAAAKQGAWVAFDGIRERHLERDIMLLQNMKEHDLLDRVLISQDAGWYTVGEKDGGGFRAYAYLFDSFLPALVREGFSTEEIELLTRTNPARAFTIRVRSVEEQE